MPVTSEQLAFTFEAPSAKPYTVTCAEVLAWAQSYTGPKFHAMLCDPPYHLTDVERSFQAKGMSIDERPGRGIRSNQRRQAKGGFMGTHWDGGDIAFKPETWKALAQHLLPGAFIMAFASSRGWHRLACAIEDSGFIIHPTIFLWTYGSGFPKATRIHDERFNGHRYGMQSMKPAAEPIIVAQVPYAGKPVQSIVTHGAGALNIGASRLGTNGGMTKHSQSNGAHRDRWEGNTPTGVWEYLGGRWPPNFALSHTPECVQVGTRQVQGSQLDHICGRESTRDYRMGRKHMQGYTDANGQETVDAWECADNCPVAKLDLQAGERTSGGDVKPYSRLTNGQYSGGFPDNTITFRRDKGNASRFFHVSDYSLDVAERLAQADPVYYCAKASRGERDKGLNGQRNIHPTVKSLKLCRWLATLLLPPDAYAPRRLVVPFCGTGSEMAGAMLAGWDDMLGIEQDATYVELAEARLRYWAGQTCSHKGSA